MCFFLWRLVEPVAANAAEERFVQKLEAEVGAGDAVLRSAVSCLGVIN